MIIFNIYCIILLTFNLVLLSSIIVKDTNLKKIFKSNEAFIIYILLILVNCYFIYCSFQQGTQINSLLNFVTIVFLISLIKRFSFSKK